MRQNALGGRAIPGPAGQAWALPQIHFPQLGVPASKEGGKRKKKGRGREGEKGKDDLHTTLFLGPVAR